MSSQPSTSYSRALPKDSHSPTQTQGPGHPVFPPSPSLYSRRDSNSSQPSVSYFLDASKGLGSYTQEPESYPCEADSLSFCSRKERSQIPHKGPPDSRISSLMLGQPDDDPHTSNLYSRPSIQIPSNSSILSIPSQPLTPRFERDKNGSPSSTSYGESPDHIYLSSPSTPSLSAHPNRRPSPPPLSMSNRFPLPLLPATPYGSSETLTLRRHQSGDLSFGEEASRTFDSWVIKLFESISEHYFVHSSICAHLQGANRVGL
jgi:hypothetical protein